MTSGLRRFLQEGPPAAPPEERCEMCATRIGIEHSHLVHLVERSLRCTCRACWMLFSNPGAGGGNYRMVPERYLCDPEFTLSESEWEELQIPVRMAFFFSNSEQGKMIACYPSPAGATESELSLESWNEGVGANRLAQQLEPDVEALLVRRESCLLVPIDACYQLVGLVRMHWKGFDGGEDAWREIDKYFAYLHERSRKLESC